jgi:thioredoxin
MVTYLAILAGAVIGYWASGLFLSPAEGGALGGRFVLALLGGLVGWWAASFAGGRYPITWAEEVTHVRTPDDFNALLVHSAREPVLVDFYANWCPPCRRGAPNINALAKEGKRVAVVNIDENPTLARRFQVAAVPTMLILREGDVALQVRGYHSADALRGLVERAAPPEA